MAFFFQRPIGIVLLLAIPIGLYVFRRFEGERSKPATRVTLVLRSAVILLLVMSISGLSVAVSARYVNTIFLMDVSDSLDEVAQSSGFRYIGEALESMGADDAAGVVLFGRRASVEVAPQKGLRTVTQESFVDGGQTDISAAIQAALASFPDVGGRRIVLLSDGNENRGNARESATVARSFGVQIYCVPLATQFVGNEVLLRGIQAPDQVKSGEMHDFTLDLYSFKPAEARISILKDGNFAGYDQVVLSAGENRLVYTDKFSQRGLHQYEVVIDSPEDTIIENNRALTFVQVLGPPLILYVSEEGEASGLLLNALATQEIRTEVRGSLDIPDSLAGLIPYDAVILDNVSGFDLSLSKMEAIERYVRDAGGGLITIGGENSYGVGGYYKTPIEKALPVDTDVSSSLNIPSLTLVMVIDKSGSMGARVQSGETKLEVVKAAAFSAIELLNPFHRVGLLAFDADFEWAVTMIDAGQKVRIAEDLFRLTSGGGTRLHDALGEAHRVLAATASSVKHIIVLSDGLAEEGDFQTLIETTARDKITVSTVAVGQDSDRMLMRDIARWGGGRSYYTDDPDKIPRIFTTETIIVARGLIVEELFLPEVRVPHEIVSGIDPESWPPLRGLVLTYLKSGAEEILSGTDDSPLLAVWRYGLGRSASFASDLKGKWGVDWLRWSQFPRFAAQLVRWTERTSSPQSLQADLSIADGGVQIMVDALNESGDFINQLKLRAVVTASATRTLEISLQQTAPGRYEGAFSVDERGMYLVTLFGRNEEQVIAPHTMGIALPYSREYVGFATNTDLLRECAQITGGEIIAVDDREAQTELFSASADSLTAFGAYHDLWFILTLAALLLFIVDIAVRKLPLPRLLRRLTVAVGLRRRSTRDERKMRPTYEELHNLIEKGYQQEQATKGGSVKWPE